MLDRVTGPIDATTRAVNSGIRGVQQQMIGVDRALRNRALSNGADEAGQQITDGQRLAIDSLASIAEAGLVSQQRLESVRDKMLRFDATRGVH